MKPSFLKTTTIKPAEKAAIVDSISNWVKINERLNSFTEEELRKMILLELQTQQRFHILHRLKRRYDRVRSDRERGEMLAGGNIKLPQKRPRNKPIKRKRKSRAKKKAA